MTLHAYQQYAAAASAYQRASQLAPQNFDWLYLLGAVQMELGAFDAAETSFRAALKLSPGDLAAQLRLGQSLAAIPDWALSTEVYRHVLNSNDDCAQAWYGLGHAQAAQGEHKAAAHSYRRACDLFPFFGAAHFALAAELRKLGNKEEADQELAAYAEHVTGEPPLEDPLFERIYSLNNSVGVHLERGAAFEKAGRLQDAIREQEAALTSDSSEVQAHINLGSLYARAGHKAQSRQHLEAALKLDSRRPDAWYNYGVLLFQEGDLEGAAKAFLRAVSINPLYPEAHNNLGAILEQQGRFDDAELEFTQALAGQPNYALAHFHLGRLLVNRQHYDEAIQHFLRSLQPKSEQTPAYLYALASTYARVHDKERALSYLRKAREGALARGQSQLVTSIDRDLQTLEGH